jgi:hypothetical protein
MLAKIMPALAGIVLCAASSGCVVTDHSVDPGPGPTGTLTTTWTLDGSSGSEVCGYFQVDRVHVVIADDAGFVVADEEPFCEDFDVSFDLSIGPYSSEVTLLDAGGGAVSDTIVTDVDVLRSTETFVDVDFPPSSIF